MGADLLASDSGISDAILSRSLARATVVESVSKIPASCHTCWPKAP